MKKRKFASGGVPTTGRDYDVSPAQYPFAATGGGSGTSNNTTVYVSGQQAEAVQQGNPFINPIMDLPSGEGAAMRRGGKVKSKRVRGDGIARRGRTKGRFV